MPVDANVWVQGLYGILLFFGAVAMYFNSRNRPAPPVQRVDSVVAGVGIGYIERETTERLIDAAERIAAATEVMADRRQAHIEEKLDDLLKQMQGAEGRSDRRRQAADADDTDATRVRRR